MNAELVLQDLEKRLNDDLKDYKSGEMMSMAEMVHGEIVTSRILGLIAELKQQYS